MVRREDYQRREQAYVKHYVLRHYLQQLALKIGNFRPGTTLNYIDGFSGPWQHATEELRDTSPHIALTELLAAQKTLREQTRSVPLRVRGMFVEKDRAAFGLLLRLLRETFPNVEVSRTAATSKTTSRRLAPSRAKARTPSPSCSSIRPAGRATGSGRSRRCCASRRARS